MCHVVIIVCERLFYLVLLGHLTPGCWRRERLQSMCEQRHKMRPRPRRQNTAVGSLNGLGQSFVEPSECETSST